MSDRAAFKPKRARPTVPADEAIVEETVLSSTEVRHRAVRGAVLITVRGAALQVLAFGGNLVLARLLVPRDFGLVALGNAVMVFGSLMATTGLTASLIRRPEPPDAADLRAVIAFQLAVTVSIAVPVALTAPLGRAGQLAAIMASSLPLLAFRTAGAVALERALLFRRLITVEIAENVLYYGWAVSTVALGWGVWGLATGVSVRVLAGTLAMIAVSPIRIVRPRWCWTRLRPLLKYGAQMQGTGAMTFVRDQGFNVAVAAVAGVTTLGLWTLVTRIVQIPGVLFSALWRVSFPAMSRLLATGDDVRPILERASALVAIAAGAILTPIVGAGPHLVTAVFGAPWADATEALPTVAFGLMIVGPVSVAAAGYLTATGDAATGLKSATFHTVAQFAVALPLLPALGVWALGIGTLVSCVIESLMLGVKAGRDSGARIFAPAITPTAVAFAASAVGWYLGSLLKPTILAVAICGTLAEVIYLSVLGVVQRSLVVEMWGTVMRSIRSVR